MITPQFQKLLIALFILMVALLIAYGIYCRRKSQSYMGTGRVPEIEQWSAKANISWAAIFILTVIFVMEVV